MIFKAVEVIPLGPLHHLPGSPIASSPKRGVSSPITSPNWGTKPVEPSQAEEKPCQRGRAHKANGRYSDQIAAPALQVASCIFDNSHEITALVEVGITPTVHHLQSRSTRTEVNALSVQKCLIEGSEVHPVGTVLLLGDISAGSCQFGLRSVPQFFDLREQLLTGKH